MAGHRPSRLFGQVLLVGLAVDGLVGLALAGRIPHDPGGRVFIPVGGVLDQFLLGLLEPLGLAATGLLDCPALFAPTLLEVVLVEAHDCSWRRAESIRVSVCWSSSRADIIASRSQSILAGQAFGG